MAYNGEVQSIDYQDVMYIEVCDNDANIITRKNKTGFRERKTLKQGYISKMVNSRNRINEKIIFLHVSNTEEICDLMHSFLD